MAVTYTRCIDYSAPGWNFDSAAACQKEIARFVHGIRTPRRSPVTAAQIVKWLRATPPEFVHAQIDAALMRGLIRISPKSLGSARGAKGAYVYHSPQHV